MKHANVKTQNLDVGFQKISAVHELSVHDLKFWSLVQFYAKKSRSWCSFEETGNSTCYV
jgi:hypothetical protein